MLLDKTWTFATVCSVYVLGSLLDSGGITVGGLNGIECAPSCLRSCCGLSWTRINGLGLGLQKRKVNFSLHSDF